MRYKSGSSADKWLFNFLQNISASLAFFCGFACLINWNYFEVVNEELSEYPIIKV